MRVRIGIPHRAVAFIAAVEVLAVVVATVGIAGLHVYGTDVARAAVIVGVAAAYQQLTSRARVLRRFLHTHGSASWSDQTSIWTCGAALLLPLGWACIVVLAVGAHTCVQTSRHRAVQWWRYAFSCSATLLAVAATVAIGRLLDSLLDGGGGPALLVTVVAQLLVYTTVSLAAITTTRLLLAPRRVPGTLRRLLPSSQDLVLEGGALLLGVTLAQFVDHSLALAVVVPALALIFQRACLVDELHAAARTDPKTGLLNAAGWQDTARGALKADPAAALLILDLDDFKAINDLHGHLVGDQVLCAVADRIRAQLRATDIAGRFGGDEFVALLPNTGPAGAAALAERLRVAIADVHLDDAQPPVRVTVTSSIGVASATVADADIDALLMLADTSLMQAKAGGRNRVHVSADAPGQPG